MAIELRLGADESAQVEVRLRGREAGGVAAGPDGILVRDQPAGFQVGLAGRPAGLPAGLLRGGCRREAGRLAGHAPPGARDTRRPGREAIGERSLERLPAGRLIASPATATLELG